MNLANLMVIDFDLTTGVTALHRDDFPLGFLGKQEIKRASDIRFDTDSQLWDIHLAVNVVGDEEFLLCEEAKGFSTYEEARKMEVKWLEFSKLQSVDPLGQEGRFILRALRAGMDVPISWI